MKANRMKPQKIAQVWMHPKIGIYVVLGFVSFCDVIVLKPGGIYRQSIYIHEGEEEL